MTPWGHDSTEVATSNVLIALNDALTHSAVLLQVNMNVSSTNNSDV